MRRWLIRHEQKELPFVVSSGTISAGYTASHDEAKYYTFTPGDNPQSAQTVSLNGVAHRLSVLSRGNQLFVNVDGFFYRFFATQLRSESAAGSAALEIRSEIPGKIIKVLVKAGDTVSPGQGVIVQEAMKMEITLTAASSRRVTEVLVEPGAQVAADEVLIRLAGDDET